MTAPLGGPNAYLHGHHESVLRSHRWRTVENSAAYLVPELYPGRDLLDVGCGPGTITVDLAQRVAPGAVLGIDAAPDAVELATAGARDRGGAHVEFAVGDVYALGLDDRSFDVVHAHQVLQHLTDPVAALCEMRRVCRPGGVVGVRDSDYAAMTFFPELPGLFAWRDLYRRVARGLGAEPDAGRRLGAWARAAGFPEVRCSASVWCFSTPADREWWGGLWADRTIRSAFAEHALRLGLADRATLDDIAEVWRNWAADPDGWFAVLHGEVLARA